MSSDISNLHLDVLDSQRLELLKKILPYIRGFILSGGTGLALQLGHRKSFDFDFFSQSPIPKHLLEQLSQSIGISNISVDTPDELTFFTKGNIKITILYYPFKSHFQPLEFEGNLLLYPIQEVAIQKAYTIGRRGEYRDYFDLYTILKNGYIQLNELTNLAKQVYDGAFDKKIFLQQLVYFGDITNFEIIPANQTPIPTPDQIKQYFETLITAYIT